ncbi:MAG: diaminopimelate epimerase [Spirochaetes bacterium]|nr:diaminopimelate epimerase [Spirochaetota bacterium]
MSFEKMHGLGNDFIVFHEVQPENYDLNALAVKLCDRHFGIGADGIILVLPSQKADICMRIINSDGSEPDMCGNGIRCFAKYAYENKLISKEKFSVETGAGIITPELIIKDGSVFSVKVNMGMPGLNRSDIPMRGNNGPVINEPLEIDDEIYMITSMLMSIPHTMVFTDNSEDIDIISTGRKIEKNVLFPQGTNVNFVQVLNPGEIKVRTWERGAGATLACGTGSCASVIASHLNNKTGKNVIVHLLYGDLNIEWKEDNSVLMTGPAESVFKGKIVID